MNRIFVVVVLVLLCLPASVFAQDEPLLIVMNGDLYTWSGDATEAVTVSATCDPTERIVSDIAMNTTDGRIAFLTEPPSVTEAVGFGAQGPLPTNIVTCDGSTLTTVAGQPDNFSFFAGDVADVAVIRTQPTWSPAGDALAWTTFNLQSGLMFLDIHKDDGSTTSTRIQLPEAMGPPAPPFITWGDAGIYMFHATLDPETFAFVELAFVFDSAGTLIVEARMPETDESRFVYDKFIVGDNGREYVGMLYSDGAWELFDPMTSEVFPANGVGELYDPSGNSDISILLTLDQVQQYVWTAKNSGGVIVDINGNNVAVPGVFPTSTEISSGGKWVFQLFDGLYYWSMTASGYINGTEPVTTGFSALAWSGAKWRIHRSR